MFADGFLADNLFEIMSLLLTAAGIWFIVQQLREAKLASQMEGMISLTDSYKKLSEEFAYLEPLFADEKWISLSLDEKYSRVLKETEIFGNMSNVLDHYELVGLLVKSKALDKHIAYRFYGSSDVDWKNYEKIVQTHRDAIQRPQIGIYWEWLEREFEKIRNDR